MAALPVGRSSNAATSLKGSRGFALEATMSPAGVVPGQMCHMVPECRPSTLLELDAHWVGVDITGTVALNGNSWRVGTDDGAGLEIQFAASVTLPSEAPAATLSVPFSFQGTLTLPDENVELTGEGTATVTLEWVVLPDLPGSWVVTQTQFEF